MIKLFFSYSHKDEELRNELDKHLTILKRNNIIDSWHDRRIDAGSDFAGSISGNMKDSDIILLLISADFLSSDYCYDIELKEALEMNAQKEAVVIPVILKPCDWQDASFGHLLALPTDGKPVVKFPSYDDGFLNITKGIKAVIKTLGKKAGAAIEKPTTIASVIERPRSSNLAIKKKISDHEKDKFLKDGFSYITNYFESSLEELKNRNSEVTYLADKVDSKTYTASLYINGKKQSECMMYVGSMLSPTGISYSNHISAAKNSLNESLSISDDGYSIFFKAMGMATYGAARETNMTFEGAAEYYWQMFIKQLQGR